ncbi:unnamed protein product [Microthlaspi erraticum]|uniref:Pectinesterase n=1 Tax=Microthlaspi erraticum TaxID=1685480 RepID=A0A6D2K478_9BRAS|nr:unnamed protein product [Microthlaspi erraticum]
MKRVTSYSYNIVCMVVTLLVYGSAAVDQLAYTVTVDTNGGGNYTTVQSAIDSIPNLNQNWIRIFIKTGIYREKLTIPKEKGFIYLQGEGIEHTVVEYDDHQATDTSATFSAFADDIVISGITFKNTYNIQNNEMEMVPAVAARMLGDRYLVTDSGFDGLQDTLFDAKGRHYYKRCVISGGIDFIFGYGQSFFEGCTLNLTLGIYAPGRLYGTITAHQRPSPSDNGGFVFSDCTITGTGKTLLGRAWGPNARVIFYGSTLSDVVLPIGWDAWHVTGQEGGLTFVESGCTGDGADTSARVPWLKQLSVNVVVGLASVSFIDQDGWISRCPIELGL